MEHREENDTNFRSFLQVEIFENWENNQSVTSYLTVFDAAVEDSGIYSCHAPHAIKKSIPVTVAISSEF